jgi:hypothetical protein
MPFFSATNRFGELSFRLLFAMNRLVALSFRFLFAMNGSGELDSDYA